MIVYSLVLLQSLLLDRWSLLRAADPWRTPGSDPTGTLSFTSFIFIALPKKSRNDLYRCVIYRWCVVMRVTLLSHSVTVNKEVSESVSEFVCESGWVRFIFFVRVQYILRVITCTALTSVFWEAEHNSVSKVNYLKVDKVKWREWWAVN